MWLVVSCIPYLKALSCPWGFMSRPVCVLMLLIVFEHLWKCMKILWTIICWQKHLDTIQGTGRVHIITQCCNRSQTPLWASTECLANRCSTCFFGAFMRCFVIKSSACVTHRQITKTGFFCTVCGLNDSFPVFPPHQWTLKIFTACWNLHDVKVLYMCASPSLGVVCTFP